MTRGLASWVMALAVASVATQARAEDAWLTSYADALKLAAKEKKVVLMDFTGSDWCGWCKKLKAEVFDKPEFADWAKKNAVLLELDFPQSKPQSDEIKKQNADLQQKFNIEGYPTIVFLDATGKEVARNGYVEGGPAAWIKAVDGLLAKKAGGAAKPAAEGGVEAGAEGWITSYEDALKLAKKEKKLVLADFTGSDWCGWCIKLKSEVFDTAEFKEWAKKNVVLLELDFPKQKQLPDDLKKQNQELAQKNNIQGYPTILFFDAKGKKVGQTGYVKGGPEAWIKEAEKAMGSKR